MDLGLYLEFLLSFLDRLPSGQSQLSEGHVEHFEEDISNPPLWDHKSDKICPCFKKVIVKEDRPTQKLYKVVSTPLKINNFVTQSQNLQSWWSPCMDTLATTTPCPLTDTLCLFFSKILPEDTRARKERGNNSPANAHFNSMDWSHGSHTLLWLRIISRISGRGSQAT